MSEQRSESQNFSNIQRQYNDIQKLLSAQLETSRQLFPQNFSKSIYSLCVINDSLGNQLELLLQQESNNHTGERIILIPYHLEKSHWVGIFIEFEANEQVKQAQYIDPANKSCVVPEILQKQFTKVYSDTILQATHLQMQSNQTDSAVLIVEQLLKAAGIKFITAFNGSSKDETSRTSTAHILKEGNKDKLDELEHILNNGLAQCNIKDISMLPREIEKSSKRITEYEEEEELEDVEKETKHLNDLKRLQQIWNEINNLKADSSILSDDQTKLRELSERLNKGLIEHRLQNMTQLKKLIQEIQQEIEKLENLGKNDAAKDKRNFLHKLQKLQELEKEIHNLSTKLNRKVVQQANLNDLVSDLAIMPSCAEKTIIELLIDFEQRLVGGYVSLPEEDKINVMLRTLHTQLESQGLLSPDTRASLDNLHVTLKSDNHSSTPHTLRELLKKIRPLNVQEIQRLVGKAKIAAGLISNKEIALLVGETGVGKSTTIQFLAGCKMRKTSVEISPGKFVDHITVDGAITNDELIHVRTSASSSSQTRYIAPVTINLSQVFGEHVTETIILCDAPGFEDTSGPEVDIANSVGVIEAIKGCKNVKILALSSYLSLGDRGQGIQKLARILINMVDKIEDKLDYIVYAFTKYPEDKDINALLTNIKVSRVNVDSSLQSDTTFVAVLDDMIDKTEDTTYKIDPIHNDRKILLKKLKNTQGIKNPRKVFRSSLSEQTKRIIDGHVQRDLQSINNAVKRKDIRLIYYYLNDLKILKDSVQQSLIEDAYAKSKYSVSESIKESCAEAMKKFNRALANQSELNQEDILDYKASVEYLEEAQILKEHFQLDPPPPNTLMENIVSELQKKAVNLNKEELYSPSVKLYLDNLSMLKNSFPEFETKYNTINKEFEKRFAILVQSVHEPISNNEFDEVAEVILQISKCLAVLKDHLGEQVERKYKYTVQALMQHLISFSEKVDTLLIKKRLDKRDVNILKKCMDTLRSAKENISLQDRILTYRNISINKTDISVKQNVNNVHTENFKGLNELYNDIIAKIRNYFDEINVKIEKLFEENRDDVINEVQTLIDELDNIRSIQELESRTSDIYYKIMDKMRVHMQQVEKSTEELLNTIIKSSEYANYKHLTRKLSRIKNAQWVNRVSASSYNNVMCHITEELVERAEQLENSLMKLDLSVKYPKNLDLAEDIVQKIKSMNVLEVYVPVLKKYRISIVKHFIHSIQRAFSHIYETFNLPDETMRQINQHLKELEKDKREYDRLDLAREHLQKHSYPDIDVLNKEIEELKASNDVEIEVEDKESLKIESQLNNLEEIVQNYKTLHQNNTEVNDYWKDQKYSSITAVYTAIDKAKTSQRAAESNKNKRAKRTNSIERRESIKKKYDLLFSRDDDDLSEHMDSSGKVEDNSREFTKKVNSVRTIATSEREKIEQEYDSINVLDVSAANDALSYIIQCKNITDHSVKELANDTDNILRKYIRECSNILNRQIDENFKRITSGDDEDTQFKHAQDLERSLQELLSFNEFEYISKCINGERKLESWRQQFNTYYRELSIKMNKSKAYGNHIDLGKQLNVAQALTWLDDFSEKETQKTKFGVLYEQFQDPHTQGARKTYDIVKTYVKNRDYTKAHIELFEIGKGCVDRKELLLIACELRRSLEVLITETKKIVNELDGKFNQQEDKESPTETIIANLEKTQIVLKIDSLKKLLDKFTEERLQSFQKDINTILSEIILKRINYIEGCLKNDNFSVAEQVIDSINRMQRDLGDHCISEYTIEKVKEVRKKLEKTFEEISKREDYSDIKTFYKNSPKIFLAKLKLAADKGYDKYDQVYTYMSNKVLTVFKEAIEKLSDAPWYERLANINSLTLAFNFLPDDLQTSLKTETEELSRQVANEKIKHEHELDEALKATNENDTGITKLGELAQKYTSYNIYELRDKLSEKVLARLGELYVNLEGYLDQRNMLSSVAIVKKIFRYREAVGTYMPEVAKNCNMVYALVTKDFSQCSKTLASISLSGETQITESAFNNIIFYVDLFHANDKKLEDILPENILQDGINGFQKMFEYLNNNAGKYQNAIAMKNIPELHKAITVAKKWDRLLEKINQRRLENGIMEVLLKNTTDVTHYADMLAKLEAEINHLRTQLNVELISDDTNIFETIRDTYFCNLKNNINTLRQIESKFKDLLPSKLDTAEIEEEITNQVRIIGSQLDSFASKQQISEKDSDQFRKYYNNLVSFDKYVRIPNFDVKDILRSSKEKIFERIINLLKQSKDPDTPVDDVAEILSYVKFLAENLSMFDTEINAQIDNALKIFKQRKGDPGIMQLIMHLENSDVGLRLISEHSCLKGEDLRRKREKMQKQDNLQYILDKLEGDNVDKDALEDNYTTFKKTYDDLLRTNLLSFDQLTEKELNLKRLIENISVLVKDVTRKPDSVTWNHTFRENLPELLAHIFAVWTLKNIQHYNTTRGIDSAKMYLLMPHVGQIIAIFRLLGIGYDKTVKIIGHKVPGSGLISSLFSKSLINNIVEIGTGEGKSVVLAVTACIFALTGVDVYCSCYSEMLSTRDKNDFDSVFRALEIEKSVEYGTFNRLCEQFLKEQCNVRQEVRDMIVNNKNTLVETTKLSHMRPKVLLIDEVDVFLSDKFYGGMYIPSVYLKSPSINALLDSIWQNKKLISLNSVKALPAYQTCAIEYSHWIFLFDEAIKDMLAALQSYESSTYIVKDDKIVYVEGESIVDNVVCGYDTIWAYYHQNEKGSITQNGLESNVGIIIKCGTFSYAEMPHDFAYIGGVTGTLRTLANVERQILQKIYAINKTTYVPSVFGKSNRIYNSNNDVHVVEESEYFMKICGEIDYVYNANRAILVFFENEEKLMAFYNSSELTSLNKDVQIITEKVSLKERELSIKRAATIGKVTLLTRKFGRGTDFICRSPQLLSNGGVHIVQTFFSEELSEECQIIGRGARQGDPGSYRMILLDSDLEKILGSAWKEELPKILGTALYEALNKARNAHYEGKCGAKHIGIEQRKAEHNASKKFMGAVVSGQIEAIKQFLTKQNQGANLIKASSRTILLMDATGSMSSLLSAAKETVCTMFERASAMLEARGLPSDAFQMQFVIYRNYNSCVDKILQVSSWNTKASNLRTFMSTIDPAGGWGNEAIEIGLWHAVNESETPDSISQVILIGDAPANRLVDVTNKRTHLGEKYWKKTKFSQPTYYATELKKLKDKNIPVHAFYLTQSAKDNFVEIARETSGRCEQLNINSPQGAELLTNFVTEEVLRKTAGDQGNDVVALYRTQYVPTTFTS